MGELYTLRWVGIRDWVRGYFLLLDIFRFAFNDRNYPVFMYNQYNSFMFHYLIPNGGIWRTRQQAGSNPISSKRAQVWWRANPGPILAEHLQSGWAGTKDA
jgi:hypothetical protein